MSSKYIYKARNSQGKLIEGVIQMNSSREVVAALHDKGLIAVAVEKVTEKVVKRTKKKTRETARRKSIKQKDIAIFCRQMATMINAGVSVMECVEDIGAMTLNLKFKEILTAVANDIKTGSSLSEALKNHPKVYNKVFTSMIRAGEESGHLDSVLNDLSGYLEASVELKRKVRSASMYPIFVAGFMGFVVAGLVLFLVPKFKSLFESLGAELPLPTLIVMNISEFAVGNIHWVVLFIIGMTFFFMAAYKTRMGKFRIDQLSLNIPIFGQIVVKVILTRFFQTLATLLKSGVDIVASLEIAGKVVGSLPVEDIINSIRFKIMEGSNMSSEMGNHSFFPKMAVRMTAIGEKSGKIDEVLIKVSEYYSSEVDATVEGFSSIIEPLLIVMLGGVVGGFVISMYLPVFKMAMAMMGGGM